MALDSSVDLVPSTERCFLFFLFFFPFWIIEENTLFGIQTFMIPPRYDEQDRHK